MLALKNKDANKRAVYSIVINKYNLLGIELKAKGKEIGDAEMLQVIQKVIKELEEEKSSYLAGGREEKANEVTAQMDCLKGYLPKLMSEEEIKNVILTLEDRSVPAVMKHFKQNYNGKCDMGLVNRVLKSL